MLLLLLLLLFTYQILFAQSPEPRRSPVARQSLLALVVFLRGRVSGHIRQANGALLVGSGGGSSSLLRCNGDTTQQLRRGYGRQNQRWLLVLVVV